MPTEPPRRVTSNRQHEEVYLLWRSELWHSVLCQNSVCSKRQHTKGSLMDLWPRIALQVSCDSQRAQPMKTDSFIRNCSFLLEFRMMGRNTRPDAGKPRGKKAKTTGSQESNLESSQEAEGISHSAPDVSLLNLSNLQKIRSRHRSLRRQSRRRNRARSLWPPRSLRPSLQCLRQSDHCRHHR